METWFGETGLKIRPDVFCHDNCELVLYILKYYFFIFSQKRKGKRNSSMIHIDSYVRCLHGVTRYLQIYNLQIFMKV